MCNPTFRYPTFRFAACGAEISRPFGTTVKHYTVRTITINRYISMGNTLKVGIVSRSF
ncbi:hypothetical protein Barb4_00639 [Bacteroidales bacterium Barb4]|nr:hypothetical protein Barb4_00639 [Bacteroidales bacterium Barb4]